ncbi:MAG: hypothetical protein UFA98_08755 [Ruminococcus sp.]|nr:hypothetical protein [Ruminococcus sp.]
MTVREFIISRVQLFFFLVTLILTATVILGALYDPQRELRYVDLLSPLFIAACCILPTCVTYYKKEPSVRQYVIRQIIELALIEAVVMLLISAPEGIEKPLFYLVLGAVIALIYILAMVMMWLQKYQQSKKLTKQLHNLQQSE